MGEETLPLYLDLGLSFVKLGEEARVALVDFSLEGSAGKEELSIDLMRYVEEAPSGVMEYLFTELMLWGRKEGYRWFNLGMAPLSGLEMRNWRRTQQFTTGCSARELRASGKHT